MILILKLKTILFKFFSLIAAGEKCKQSNDTICLAHFHLKFLSSLCQKCLLDIGLNETSEIFSIQTHRIKLSLSNFLSVSKRVYYKTKHLLIAKLLITKLIPVQHKNKKCVAGRHLLNES